MRGLRVVGQELRRAAERVHDHRVVERGGDDLAACRRCAHRRQIGLVGHRGVVLAGDERLRRRGRLEVDDVHVLHRQAVLLQEPGQREVGRGAGRGRGDRLALEVGDLRDVVAHGHAVGAVALVELEDLLGRDAVGVPDDPGLDRGRRALDVARGDREVAVLLRDLLDVDVEAVLLEDAGFLGERQRREAGPARNADGDLRSCAAAGADTRRAALAAKTLKLSMIVFLLLVYGLSLLVCSHPRGVLLHGACRDSVSLLHKLCRDLTRVDPSQPPLKRATSLCDSPG